MNNFAVTERKPTVHTIARADAPSPYSSHVRIEAVSKGGSYRATGILYRDDGRPKFYTPTLFATSQEAVVASSEWAARNGVRHLYVIEDKA